MPIQVTHIMTRTFFAQQSIRKRRELEQKRRTEYFTEATVKYAFGHLSGHICGVRWWCMMKELVRLKRWKKSCNMYSRRKTYLSQKSMLNIILGRCPDGNHLVQLGFSDFGWNILPTFTTISTKSNYEWMPHHRTIAHLVSRQEDNRRHEGHIKRSLCWEWLFHSLFKPTLEASSGYDIWIHI